MQPSDRIPCHLQSRVAQIVSVTEVLIEFTRLGLVDNAWKLDAVACPCHCRLALIKFSGRLEG